MTSKRCSFANPTGRPNRRVQRERFFLAITKVPDWMDDTIFPHVLRKSNG